jgi:hypothetical protein
MPARRLPSLFYAGSVLALVFGLGACTPGGQFDPTEALSSDVFGTKKKLQGEREPVFPQGVPGAETGVPPDLVKGYQPAPEQAAVAEGSAAPQLTAAEKPKPKPKPRPKVAKTPPAASQATQAPWPPAQSTPAQGRPAQANWPPPPGQPAQTNWPPPPGQPEQGAAAQTNWPAPPRQAQ